MLQEFYQHAHLKHSNIIKFNVLFLRWTITKSKSIYNICENHNVNFVIQRDRDQKAHRPKSSTRLSVNHLVKVSHSNDNIDYADNPVMTIARFSLENVEHNHKLN